MTKELPVILRPIKKNDLENLHRLSQKAKPGLTSLSKEKSVLKKMIDISMKSFKKTPSKLTGDESYFFVLENIRTKELLGSSRIIAKTGTLHPHYYFNLIPVSRKSKSLAITKNHLILQLGITRMGASEIGTLFLKEAQRGGGLGRLLSLGRFLFMAEHPERTDKTIIAEMRGISDEKGDSPFWNSLGQKFFDISFLEANERAVKKNDFLEELIPRYPIYSHFLSQKAQKVIGVPHPNTVAALKLLEQEGFRKNNHIDILDGGPQVSVMSSKIRSIKDSFIADIHPLEKTKPELDAYLLSKGKKEDFRAYIAKGIRIGSKLYIKKESIDLFSIKKKEPIRAVLLYPRRKNER